MGHRIRRRLIAAFVLTTVWACERPLPAGSVTFTGSATCGQCHEAEYKAWTQSQHAVAMQRATGNAVLGDFRNAKLTSGRVTSTFSRRANAYVVRTQAADGSLRDFKIRFAFGVWPLQQYLVDYTGGRLQALSIAWDARPDTQGGQRWFSLALNDVIQHGTAQHW